MLATITERESLGRWLSRTRSQLFSAKPRWAGVGSGARPRDRRPRVYAMSSHILERRHNRVFITANNEYHMRDLTCVAVRDRHTRLWNTRHQAVGCKLTAGLHSLCGHGRFRYGLAEIGDQLCFDNNLLTTSIEAVERPSKNTISSYPLPVHGESCRGSAQWKTTTEAIT
jgi:hypothetical protein